MEHERPSTTSVMLHIHRIIGPPPALQPADSVTKGGERLYCGLVADADTRCEALSAAPSERCPKAAAVMLESRDGRVYLCGTHIDQHRRDQPVVLPERA